VKSLGQSGLMGGTGVLRNRLLVMRTGEKDITMKIENRSLVIINESRMPVE